MQAASSVCEGEGPAPGCSVHRAQSPGTPAVHEAGRSKRLSAQTLPGSPEQAQATAGLQARSSHATPQRLELLGRSSKT